MTDEWPSLRATSTGVQAVPAEPMLFAPRPLQASAEAAIQLTRAPPPRAARASLKIVVIRQVRVGRVVRLAG